MGQNRVELLTPALSEQCSNRLSYWPALAPRQGALIEKMLLAQAPIIATMTRNVSPPLGGRQCRFEEQLATVSGMGSRREPELALRQAVLH
jgi:hypothetical protein